jgi:teichuronic acid biosynthesis glycosyltransferase TuaH
MNQASFLVLSANTPWVYALAEALAQAHPTHAVRFYDWRNYTRLNPTWPNASAPPQLARSVCTFLPGYAGHLEWLFRPYLQRSIERWCDELQSTCGKHPWVMVPYPYLAPWVRRIPGDKLIYYNLDDYVLYQPSRKQKILAWEAELVDRAERVLCIARSQVEALRQRYPRKAESIHHFPLGVVEEYINPNPEIPAEPRTVGYVGNLSDRVDWQLILPVVRGCPEATFIFVGGLNEGFKSASLDPWQRDREVVLSLPNVRHIDKVPQEQVAQYYRSFAINWIPYAVDHPFNRAACPTKVMDAIAAGRPVLSSDIPECRLYPDWIEIFHSPEEAIAKIGRQIDRTENQATKPPSGDRVAFARQQTWQMRAKTLEQLVLQL